MKNWELNRRTSVLSEKMKAVPCSGIRIDLDSFPEEEKLLISKACKLEEADFSPNLPKEVVDENHKLLCKFFEVTARRVVELFVDMIPNSLCCDELERWYFKLHFFNFLADFTDCYKRLRKWSEEERQEMLKLLEETGGTDKFFRFPRGYLERNSAEAKKVTEEEENEHYDRV